MTGARFIGRLNAPDQRWGRFDATWPLAVLTIDEDTLTLAVRGPLRRLSSGIAVQLSDVACAYPLKGRLNWSGVGFDFADGRIAYFWRSRQRNAVLDRCREVGICIESVPRSPTAVRRPWLHSG